MILTVSFRKCLWACEKYSGGRPLKESYEDYRRYLIQVLEYRATIKKHIKVLEHLIGIFKEHWTAREKKEWIGTTEAYARRELPLVVPITFINQYVRRYG